MNDGSDLHDLVHFGMDRGLPRSVDNQTRVATLSMIATLRSNNNLVVLTVALFPDIAVEAG